MRNCSLELYAFAWATYCGLQGQQTLCYIKPAGDETEKPEVKTESTEEAFLDMVRKMWAELLGCVAETGEAKNYCTFWRRKPRYRGTWWWKEGKEGRCESPLGEQACRTGCVSIFFKSVFLMLFLCVFFFSFQIACLVPIDQFQLYKRLKFERGVNLLRSPTFLFQVLVEAAVLHTAKTKPVGWDREETENDVFVWKV